MLKAFRTDRIVAASSVLIFSIAVHAAEPIPLPKSADVCTHEGVVAKDKLATHFLKSYPVSALAWSTCVGTTPSPGTPREILGGLLTDQAMKKCTGTDATYLDTILGTMFALLSGTQKHRFEPPSQVEPAAYFSSSDSEDRIICVKGTDGPPVEDSAKSIPPNLPQSSRVRVRGNPSHLVTDRAEEKPFATTDKTTLSYTDNSVAGTESGKIVGYLGYAFPFSLELGDRAALIPYIGINRSIVKVDPGFTAKPSRVDTRALGVVGSLYRGRDTSGDLINVRPEYLVDEETSANILSLNTEYFPIVGSVVNGFLPLGQDASVYLTPIFGLKANFGRYTDRGNPAVAANNKDFVRVGAQYGITLATTSEALPFEFSSVKTSLASVKGDTSVTYHKTTLSYSLDQKKYAAIGLTHSRGRREDTVKYERQWELGFQFRY